MRAPARPESAAAAASYFLHAGARFTRWGAVASLAAWLAACSQQTTTAQLRALEPTGDASALCLAQDETGAFTRGVDRSECPDYLDVDPSTHQRHLHLLVTQPQRGEVAVMDLAAPLGQEVIDLESTQPGYNFLPVGAEPGALVSTPGGVASFVGVREAGREGIFALPSSCVGPRPAGSPLRDIRTWPACRLPSAPGPIQVLIDPAIDDDADPATPPRVRASCDAAYVEAAELAGTAPAASRAECPADLSTETRSPGRRKLVVAMPSLSELWVLDAQDLLDREPGSFDACSPERRFELQVDQESLSERIPDDLTPASPSCLPVGFNHGPAPSNVRPFPSDFALDSQQRLFVADAQAPVIHVLDASDPCTLSNLPSLHSLSYSDPNAFITTSRVAVSPLTNAGKRFVYAVDSSQTSTAGSLMAFDVSPNSTLRTPIVRERSALNPGEPPDRILLSHDVADVEFMFTDYPAADPNTGAAVEGVACDPNPLAPTNSIPTLYRPSSDLTLGAGPSTLRGTFAFAALHSGQVEVIDVEDLDAACRRPRFTNPSPTEDIYGCKNDDPTVPNGDYSTASGLTVTDEISCNVVEPHRARSNAFLLNNSTAPTAGLTSFPTLTLSTGRSVATDQSDEGRDQPKLLPARYGTDPAETDTLEVGPLTYTIDSTAADPATATTSSLLLSYQEPRAYIPNESFSVTYEGVVRTASESVFSVDEATGLGVISGGANASFCSSGIQDVDAAAEVGRSMHVSNSGDLTRFSRDHADYVQITSDLLDEDDPYWQPGSAGSQCGDELYQSTGNPAAQRGRDLCELFFGTAANPATTRDLRVVAASEDHLTVEPRSWDPSSASEQRRLQLLHFTNCCFHGPPIYEVRGGSQWIVRGSVSGFSHHVIADPTSGRCVNDCNPLTQRLAGRAFEISCSDKCPLNADGNPVVGAARPGEDFVCVVDDTTGGIDPGKPGAECIFQSLTTRFAIYRGQPPAQQPGMPQQANTLQQPGTQRDTTFRWQLSGGFSPLTVSLTTSADRPLSAPQTLVPLPELGQLMVTDAASPGLVFIGVNTTTLTTNSVF